MKGNNEINSNFPSVILINYLSLKYNCTMHSLSKKFFLLCVSITIAISSHAYDRSVFLYSSGNDANDGSTAESAVATLGRAYALIAQAGCADNIIYVSGEVNGYTAGALSDASAICPFNGTNFALTIQGVAGTSPKITGNKTVRLFRLRSDMVLKLNDLTLSGTPGDTATFEGTCIFMDGGGSIEADSVIFENFKNRSNGGVLSALKTSANIPLMSFKNCVFKNNACATAGSNTGYGSVLRVNDGVNNGKIYFENCAFVNNNALYGTTFFRQATVATPSLFPEISFVNSTFTGNTNGNGNSGSITLFSTNMKLNVINCTLKNNLINGGVRAGDISPIVNIFNSILEGNGNSDVNYNAINKNLTIKNSLIATKRNVHDSVYVKPAGYTMSTILNDFDSTTYTFSPLEGSFALKYGDAQYLKNLNIYTDQLGYQRNFTNSRCSTGAVENPVKQVCSGCESKEYTHLIIYGQSLSPGHESHVTLSSQNVQGNYMIGDQIWINYGNGDSQNLHPLQGSRAKTAIDIIESPLLGAANHIQIKGMHPNIIATSTGTSGKSIEELSKESQTTTLYNDYTTALNIGNTIVNKSNSTITCPALFWLQGEWNYVGGNGLTPGSSATLDKNEYKSLMIKLKNNMQNDIKSIYGQTVAPTFITYQCGSQYTRGRELPIGMAQLEASNENSDIICAGPVYPMTDVGGHLDANGYRWYGEMLGKVYYKTKILHEDFKPLQPLELSRDNTDQKKVIIKFLVPKLPLVLDDKTLWKISDYGFEVYNNNTRQTISDVSISNDCVILTCTQNLTGKIEVVYAGLNATYVSASGNGRGSGNLRDNDDYQAVFTYQDLDKKDTNGNYVFPRKAGEESLSLRPTFEPKDTSGNVIYDKPYPLYNSSVAFYYAIPDGEQKYTVPNLIGATSVLSTLQNGNIRIKQNGKSISIFSDANTDVIAELFELTGKRIGGVINVPMNRKLNLSQLSNGVYLVKITAANEIKTVKICL